MTATNKATFTINGINIDGELFAHLSNHLGRHSIAYTFFTTYHQTESVPTELVSDAFNEGMLGGMYGVYHASAIQNIHNTELREAFREGYNAGRQSLRSERNTH